MDQFVNPEQVIDSLDFYGPMVIADFGAGAGFFSVPIAKKISQEGKVYSFDIQEPPLEVIRARAKESHLHNIETIRADLEKARGSQLASQSVDRVIIANILFQASAKEQIIKEAYRILKKRGKMIFVEWNTDELTIPLGPLRRTRISRDMIRSWLKPLECPIEKEFAIGGHHYGMVFIKSGAKDE